MQVLELDWTYAADDAFDFFKYEHAFEFRDNFETVCLSDMDDPSEVDAPSNESSVFVPDFCF
jgi:hypothetical protein